jgi:hypothetical protein
MGEAEGENGGREGDSRILGRGGFVEEVLVGGRAISMGARAVEKELEFGKQPRQVYLCRSLIRKLKNKDKDSTSKSRCFTEIC